MHSTSNVQADGWMSEAIRAAMRAAEEGEVPVGALVLLNDRPISLAWNRTESLKDVTGHAEVIALRRASQKLGNHRLPGVTLVSTLEPCLMCLGAILEARVSRLIYGAEDPQRGALFVIEKGGLDHMPIASIEIVGGVLRERCRSLIQAYFKSRRGEDRPVDPPDSRREGIKIDNG